MKAEAPSPKPGIPEGVNQARDYESLARHALPAPIHAYIAGGSGRDVTLHANRYAFGELAVWPRPLRDVGEGHTRCRVLGRDYAHPILLAPVAYQALAHPLAELETARGAAATDTCLVASTLASTRLEDIARHAGRERWFQLYFQPHREATLDLVKRAEAAGYTALVVTLDAQVQVPSQTALRAGFRMPAEIWPVNLDGYPVAAPPAPEPGCSRVFQGLMGTAPGWADLDWLQRHTALPVVVKGVLHAEDALALRNLGVAGLVVSNHGGRTLDGVPASLAALPAIRRMVGEDYPLLLDGGIRSGTDVFKALALGADAVLVGRLQVHALAVAGALGVAHMLRLLREELELTMAVAGCARVAEIGPACLHREGKPC